MLHAGMDMHKRFSVVTVVDDEGREVVEGRRIRNKETEILVLASGKAQEDQVKDRGLVNRTRQASWKGQARQRLHLDQRVKDRHEYQSCPVLYGFQVSGFDTSQFVGRDKPGQRTLPQGPLGVELGAQGGQIPQTGNQAQLRVAHPRLGKQPSQLATKFWIGSLAAQGLALPSSQREIWMVDAPPIVRLSADQ